MRTVRASRKGCTVQSSAGKRQTRWSRAIGVSVKRVESSLLTARTHREHRSAKLGLAPVALALQYSVDHTFGGDHLHGPKSAAFADEVMKNPLLPRRRDFVDNSTAIAAAVFAEAVVGRAIESISEKEKVGIWM